jgi:hypothetical protein
MEGIPQQPEDRANMLTNVSDAARVRDIVYEQFNIRPTQAREKRERQAEQAEHLVKAIQEYAKYQHWLKEQVTHPQIPDRPYKDLFAFEPWEQAIFFGRETIANDIGGRILQPGNRLNVLHAASGAGKTSLIRAGMIPRLLGKNHPTLYTTPAKYPEDIYIYEPVTSLVPFAPDFDDLPLSDFLRMLALSLGCSETSPLVVFLDQFERFLGQADAGQMQRVDRELASFVTNNDFNLPLRLLICVRGDYLSPLDRLKTI